MTDQHGEMVGPVLPVMYVRFSDNGLHIRKWGLLPFDGGTAYYPAAQQSREAEPVEALDWALSVIESDGKGGRQTAVPIGFKKARAALRAAQERGS